MQVRTSNCPDSLQSAAAHGAAAGYRLVISVLNGPITEPLLHPLLQRGYACGVRYACMRIAVLLGQT